MSGLKHAGSFRDLTVYQKSRQLQNEIYKITKSFPKEEIYSLTDQIRRSSRSVVANLAETWAKRRYEKHFIRKLTDSDGEQMETQHWIETALDCQYIDQKTGSQLLGTCLEIGRMLGGMMEKAEIVRFDPDTQAFSWTPTLDQDGTYPGVLFSVTDGIDTDTETITITVRKAGATDFNADGKADLLFRQPSTGDLVAWYMNGVTKTGGAALSTKPGSTSWVPVGLGDFGAAPPVKDATALETAAPDGKPDILFRHQPTGQHVVWSMNGVTKTGGAALVPAGPQDTRWRAVALADYNLDGKTDILAG